jgi:chemotaxis protein MotB
MSLLLTFFIMLASMSVLKEEDKYHAMADSIRREFGYDKSALSPLPGESSPMNSLLRQILGLGRAKRQDTANGGNQVESVVGESTQVQTIRFGKHSTLGGVIFFDEDASELTQAHMRDLDVFITQIQGKPQKVEVRGHTSRKPADLQLGYRDHWDLAYARCYNAMQYLIKKGIEPERVRLGSAASYEPAEAGIDPGLRKRNARVEILLWDERVVESMPKE